MSLAPPTDIVMEVARAADPARAAAVVDKLNALARAGTASPEDFSTALKGAAAAPGPVARMAAAAPSRAAKAETQLESVMLGQFIGEMMPKDAPSVFGQGYAGDMWRSMLAERVADQIAASGRLGLASRLFAGHPLVRHASLFSPTGAAALPSASGDEAVRGALRSASSAPS